MNSTDILLNVPMAGRMTIRAKMILWEVLGRHAIGDSDQLSSLPEALRKPFRRLCILLLGKEVVSEGQHDGMMRLAERVALTGYASKMQAGLAAVELGSWTGIGTCFLALGARHAKAGCIYAVDTFKGSTTLAFEADGYKKNIALLRGDSLTAFFRHFQLLRLVAKVKAEPLVGMTTEVADRYSGGPVGVLLVDADHSYESCKSDFLAWERHLAPGAIVMFHDYEPGFSGVIRAVDELVNTQPLEHMETVCTLKIYRFGPPRS